MAGGYGKAWTPSEVTRLKLLAAQGLDAKRIAADLGRTQPGVVARAGKERISLDPRKYLP